MYPLRFQPIFQRYLWGGRQLADVLNKPTGDQPAAESWEVVDHGEHQSVVAGGPLAGKTLRQLIDQHGADLLGAAVLEAISAEAIPEHLRRRFPLLLKFLDAQQPLSVQVHPNDEFGATLAPPDLGKTEAWYVMHAKPGAKIYAGLKPGVSAADFSAAVAAGKTESMLHSFAATAGDCVFIPAGTMHAIGAGLLIAEIQQASNTTFRVFDWDRTDSKGNGRPLHLESAIAVTDFNSGPVQPIRASVEATGNSGKESSAAFSTTLVACDKFVMNKISSSDAFELGGDGRFRILAVTAGSVRVAGDASPEELRLGETMLLPACLPAQQLVPSAGGIEMLEVHLPS
jgi:mannose-6-phosphate isomerase